MQSRTAMLGTLLLSAAILLASPRLALTPGPVTEGHAEIAGNCLSCHTLLRGLPAAKCIACHQLDSIGITRRDLAEPAPVRPALAGMHAEFRTADCLDCHTDHAGADPALATHAFSHEALSATGRERCTGCHASSRPTDGLHREAGDKCGSCHTTRAWTPATFEHETLSATQRAQCTSCHTGDLPSDPLHRDVGTDCAACHTTRAWTPATFEHQRYFVLDRDHDASCRTCHTEPANYKAYTCYGCHEHTPANVVGQHREEGISNLRDCARCHRSGEGEGGEGHGGRERD